MTLTTLVAPYIKHKSRSTVDDFLPEKKIQSLFNFLAEVEDGKEENMIKRNIQ